VKLLLFALSFSATTFAWQPSVPLTDQRVIELARSGVHPDELARIIAMAPQVSFDLMPGAEQQMMQAGVTEDTLKAMAIRESGPNPRSLPPRVSPNPLRTALVPRALQPSSSVESPNQTLRVSERHWLRYDGGSVSNLKTGSTVKLYLDQSRIHIVKGHSDVITLPAAAITEISYGQDVHRRVGAAIGLAAVSFGAGALMALSKSKKHFIGITWDDGAGNRGGAEFQADKKDYRGVLTGLEGITGRKPVSSEAMTVEN
jgi:hypothetical protein